MAHRTLGGKCVVSIRSLGCPLAAGSPLGVVGVIDESSFEKSGPHSVGVKRQSCGHLGKTENCQVGVFLIATVPAGEALLDHQRYLPKEWVNDRSA